MVLTTIKPQWLSILELQVLRVVALSSISRGRTRCCISVQQGTQMPLEPTHLIVVRAPEAFIYKQEIPRFRSALTLRATPLASVFAHDVHAMGKEMFPLLLQLKALSPRRSSAGKNVFAYLLHRGGAE